MTSLVKKNVGHALLILYPSQGHINPMLQFGKRICSHGRSATAAITRFISATTTPDAGKVSLETISDGFDEDGFAAAESISAYLASLESVGSQTLDALLQSLADRGQPVSVVVYDAFLPWAVEVARRHGAAAAAFFTQSVAVDVIYCHVWEGRLRFPVEAAVEKLQGLPRLEPEELPSFISAPAVHYAAYLELVLNQYKNLEDADFMLINSFYELERKEMDWMMSVRTARTIGPTVPSAYLDGRIPGDSRLGLVATIKDRANEIYKKVEDLKSIRGRNQDAILAACLYIACRQEDRPRTVKEICSVANGATKKEIGRAKEFIVKQLEVEMGQSMEMGTIHAGDFLRRFCSHLGMTNQAVKAAQEAVQKSEELDIRRSPISIAAAVIYMITQLSEEKKPLKDISLATGVAEGTIRNSYKDLYPYASRLIPTSFAKEEDLKNLCSP